MLQSSGREVAVEILERLRTHATVNGVKLPFTANTPYINTIPAEQQPRFSRRSRLERRIKSLVRWNALAMVVRANKAEDGIGGHISTYASAATLYEVGFNHFFRARTETFDGRHDLLPGPRLAGHLRARVSRRPPRRSSIWRTSAAS